MKCALVYFSSTGITPRYALEITKGLAKNNNQIEFHFIRLKKGKLVDLTNFDLIGVGSPSYSFRAPRLATRLLRKLNFQKKPFFVFCTYNSIAGNVLWNLYQSVKPTAGPCLGYIKQGVAVNIRAWKPKITSEKELKRITCDAFEKAAKFGSIILQRYEQLSSIQNTSEWVPPKKIIFQIWAPFLTWGWEMMFTVGFKRVDKKKCTNCALCESVICPSGAIELTKDNYPKFKERYCIGCNGCVNLCPVDAIWTYKTRNKKPYNLYKEFILNEKNIQTKLNNKLINKTLK
jgi:Pyruvate/2-oxoacid:ferredoxin oxidoreductase delta subunit